jgi:hypothetical protein
MVPITNEHYPVVTGFICRKCCMLFSITKYLHTFQSRKSHGIFGKMRKKRLQFAILVTLTLICIVSINSGVIQNRLVSIDDNTRIGEVFNVIDFTHKFQIVTRITPSYKGLLKRQISSILENTDPYQFDIHYEVIKFASSDTIETNPTDYRLPHNAHFLSQKPSFLLEMIQFAGKPILYLDADLVVLHSPYSVMGLEPFQKNIHSIFNNPYDNPQPFSLQNLDFGVVNW